MRISDWSSDVCSSYLPALADRPDTHARSAFQLGPSHRRFPASPGPIPGAGGATNRAHRHSRHLYPARSLRVSASPREPLSLLSLRLCANHSKGFEQSFDVVHRNHADRLDLARRAALDHRREHFATEFDELHEDRKSTSLNSRN